MTYFIITYFNYTRCAKKPQSKSNSNFILIKSPCRHHEISIAYAERAYAANVKSQFSIVATEALNRAFYCLSVVTQFGRNAPCKFYGTHLGIGADRSPYFEKNR